jgi:hypothetical protein
MFSYRKIHNNDDIKTDFISDEMLLEEQKDWDRIKKLPKFRDIEHKISLDDVFFILIFEEDADLYKHRAIAIHDDYYVIKNDDCPIKEIIGYFYNKRKGE